MAEHPKFEPDWDSVMTPKRKRGWTEGALNAINRGIAAVPMLPHEVGTKLVSLFPTMKPYEFGSDTERLYRKMQGIGMLTDRDLERATGAQQLTENMLGTAASGLGGGLMFRAPAMIAAGGRGALSSVPVLREHARQMALYDAGIPTAMEPIATGFEQRGNAAAAATTRLLGPLAASGFLPQTGAAISRPMSKAAHATGVPQRVGDMLSRMPGSSAEYIRNLGDRITRDAEMSAKVGYGQTSDLARTESALRRLERRTGPATELRTPANMEGLRVSVPEMIPSSGTTLRARAADAFRKAEELKAAIKSPEGYRKLIEDRLANKQTIEQMPFERVSAEDIGAASRGTQNALEDIITNAPTSGAGEGQIAKAVADRTSQIAKDLYAKLPGSGGGFNAMADKILDLQYKAQDWKNKAWQALGDARDDVFVDAAPLREGESNLRALHGSSAMPAGEGSPIMRDIKNTFESLYKKAEASNLAKQEQIRQEQRALLTGGFGSSPINVSQGIPAEKVRIGDLRERYRELNNMWEQASPTERLLIGKLKRSINETLGQDAEYKKLWDVAKQENVFYKDLTDPKSVYGKAFEYTDPDKAKAYLSDNIRKVFSGQQSGMNADELGDLFGKFSTKDELQNLFRGALADTFTLKATKTGALPTELPSNIKAARGELTAAQTFANRIGIPDDELNALGKQAAMDADSAAEKMSQLKAFSDNPRGFMSRAVTGNPDQQRLVQQVVQEVGSVDPTLAKALNAGVVQAVESHAFQQLNGQNLGELSRDPFMFVSKAVMGRPQEVRQVKSALEAAMPAPVGPSKALMVEDDISRTNRAIEGQAEMGRNLQRAGMEANQVGGLGDTDVANLAALGGVAVGGNPFTYGRAARLGESIANKIAHPLTNTNLYGSLLADPSKYMGLVQANPLFSMRGATKLLPQSMGAVENTFSPSRSMDLKVHAAAQPTIDDIPDWGEEPEVKESTSIDDIPDWGE